MATHSKPSAGGLSIKSPQAGAWQLRGADFYLALKRIALVVACYQLSRLFFWAINPTLYRDVMASALASAFAMGFRFDLSTVLTVNLPFLLLTLSPLGRRRVWGYAMRAWFLSTNFIFLLLDLTDAEYVKFTGRRTGGYVLRMLADVLAQLPQLLLHYWYLPALGILLVYGLKKAYAEQERFIYPLPYWLGWLCYLLAIGLAVLGIRGSFQLKPLLPGHAFTLEPSKLGTLALNTPFVFFKDIGNPEAERLTWGGTEADVLHVFCRPVSQPPQPICKGKNVVVLILESFGTEYTGLESPARPSYTPFLDSLAKKSTWLPHFYANGRRSQEALPAIFAGLPSLQEEAFISSIYTTDAVYGLPEAARNQGYITAFFHGGRNGTMGFDFFAGKLGFSNYYGLDQYPNKADYDGNWGIFDKPYLAYVAATLSTFKQPFFGGCFTLSSHQPYTLPPGTEGKYPEGTLPIHKVIRYTDDALRGFFAMARKTTWYSNTLFILTADHAQMSELPKYNTGAGVFDVPCLIYCPSVKIDIDTSQARQAADITTTVADLIGVPLTHPSIFSSSMLRSDTSRILTYTDGQFYWIERNGYATLPISGSQIKIFGSISNPILKEKLLKASTALYVNGLIDNRLYPACDLRK